MLQPIMWRNDKISVGDELKLPPRTLDVSAANLLTQGHRRFHAGINAMQCTSVSGSCNRETVLLTSCAALVQKVPVHFGEGERLFYGQVQDAAVPIRQALAHHPEAGSSWAVPPAEAAADDAPPSPREPDHPNPALTGPAHTQTRSKSPCLLLAQCPIEGKMSVWIGSFLGFVIAVMRVTAHEDGCARCRVLYSMAAKKTGKRS